MPEYLAPGVYVEETSFRAKSIEGVATSTAGFVGQARFGPTSGLPVLITSFEEFQRHFGGLEDLLLSNDDVLVITPNHLAHAVRLFFENGGKRVYVSRVWQATSPDSDGRAATPLDISGNQLYLRARFPGQGGNLDVRVKAFRSGNLLTASTVNPTLTGLRRGDVVEVVELTNGANAPTATKSREVGKTSPLTQANLFAVDFDVDARKLVLIDGRGEEKDLSTVGVVQKISMDLIIQASGRGTAGLRQDLVQGLSTHPDSDLFIGRVLRHEDPNKGIEPPADSTQRVFLDPNNSTIPTGDDKKAAKAAFSTALLMALTTPDILVLRGGDDGIVATAEMVQGNGSGHQVTGLAALAEIEDIAIVAAPGSASLSLDSETSQAIRNALITHCELLRYRIAILAGPRDAGQNEIREVRSKHDSKYAALYYPWVVVNRPGTARETLQLSSEGAIAGVYARTDIERGVHKAPANETVRGVLRFSQNVTKGEQDVLNPEGINCLRMLEGRGYRVWGARTITSDPEWMYVNVRRLFIFLEHSIDRSTQWAVFEPNNEELWLKIRLTIEGFLYDVWRSGALLGSKPEEAYFVRCDRSTMSQSDLDNGRLICLIGVAPTKPAEFVIFRIGQWTADAAII